MKLNYYQLSITQIHELLKSGALSVQELITLVFKRLKEWEWCHGVSTSLKSQALATAHTLTTQTINSDNLLWAIPCALKDNIITINVLTTACSNILANFVPNYDSTVNKLLTQAQTINIAKTTMDELGMGGDGLYANSGYVYNPWNKAHIAGGSSSGSAVLVAAGIVSFAIGSDTGDSVRKPAAYCGIIGFKPTYGLISRNGIIPYAPSLDTVGILSNYVSDIALVLDILVKYDEFDATSIPSQQENYFANLQDNIKGTNIAILNYDDYQWDNNLQTTFDETMTFLQEAGAKVEKVIFDRNLLKLLLPAYMTISFSEATSCHSNLTGINFGVQKSGANYEEIMKNSRTAGFGDMVKKRHLIGAYTLMMQNNSESLFMQAKKIRTLIIDGLNQLFKKYDAFIIMPSINEAPKIADILNKKEIFQEQTIAHYSEDLLLLSNFNGGPSITIPLTTKNDLPIGININCAPFNDQLALNIAAFLSKKINFKNKLLGD